MASAGHTHTPQIALALIVCGTILALAGTDLVLPAIPSLPLSIDGTLEQAQLVLASFAAGAAIGLLAFGEIGARFDQRWLLLGAFGLYAALSLLAAFSASITELIIIRFFQGFSSSAPAVFAPGIIRAMFSERGALRAIGLMGSIESLTPAFAPVVGAWLLTLFDWRASFTVTAALTLILSVFWLRYSQHVPIVVAPKAGGGYWPLLRNRSFMRYPLSHACTLGGLLIFVFGAPTAITVSMGGDLSVFVIMQVIGISLFILSTNLTHLLVDRFGSETMIIAGSVLSAAGCGTILLWGWLGGEDPRWLWLLFAPVNLGLGMRGPPGFYQAIVAAGDNSSRGAALVILFILLVAAGGTGIVAPFITDGLVPLSLTAFLVSVGSILCLSALQTSPQPGN